jgi:hypothetical protein
MCVQASCTGLTSSFVASMKKTEIFLTWNLFEVITIPYYEMYNKR